METEDSEQGTEKNEHKKGRAGRILSRLAVLLALVILLYTCHVCFPGAEAKVRSWVTLGEQSRTAQAFSAVAQSLRQGDGVTEAFSSGYSVLTGGKN
jgi:hypothetical protein